MLLSSFITQAIDVLWCSMLNVDLACDIAYMHQRRFCTRIFGVHGPVVVFKGPFIATQLNSTGR